MDYGQQIRIGVPGKHTGEPGAEMAPAMSAHREICLCWYCANFKPNSPNHPEGEPSNPDNCPIAQALYGLCVEHDMVTPVVRCAAFVEKSGQA